jgi:hypothetical protein
MHSLITGGFFTSFLPLLHGCASHQTEHFRIRKLRRDGIRIDDSVPALTIRLLRHLSVDYDLIFCQVCRRVPFG